MRIPHRRTPLLSLVAQLALLALCAGCGANRDATEKELAELRAEVTRLRAGQAAITERVEGLEIDRGTFAKGAASAAPSAPGTPSAPSGNGGGDRPELSVVRLSPSEGDGDTDSDAPRPLVRAVGSDGSIQKGAPSKAKDARTNPKKGASKKDAGPTVKP